MSQLGYDASNIHVVHIAPASPKLSPNSDYILSSSDLVINGLNHTGPGSVPLPNTVIAPSSSDFLGHGLIEIYLSHPKSIKKIKDSVDKAFRSLTKPDMEEHLFQVTYNYTPPFAKSHASPNIVFVDNNRDWVSKAYPYTQDSYLENVPNTNKYKIKPVNAFKSLSFQHDKTDRENNIITIDQCSSIPNNDPFILGEKSEEKIRYPYYAQPPNTKVIVTVRDRYGVKLQSAEQSINEMRNSGYDYQGIFLDLKAKNPYSDKEKAFIKQHKLETKYELHSDVIALPTTS